MNIHHFKKYVLGLSLGIGLIVPGLTVQAQNWRNHQSQHNDRRPEHQTQPRVQPHTQPQMQQHQVRQEIQRDRQQDRREIWRREAQRDHEQWRNQEQRRAWERERERERQRALLERERRVYPAYPYRYRNNGYYGNGNYGYGGYGSSAEEQKGYRDGLNRGREDAQTRRIADPNNSSHFRSGNAAYRQGFSRGYSVGYRQYR
jgi:hypothetical protein